MEIKDRRKFFNKERKVLLKGGTKEWISRWTAMTGAIGTALLVAVLGIVGVSLISLLMMFVFLMVGLYQLSTIHM